MELKFKRDTSFRKQFFVPESFAHPAKMDTQLLLWIVERYTKSGEVILDPMAGMGTTMLACTLGRNVVLVELEEKFCKMCKSNWEKVSAMPQLGYEMGQCNIVQGDARQLEGLLFDKIITSPPFGRDKGGEKGMLVNDPKRKEDASLYRTYSSPNNIDNLPYGQIDKIVTSPPYGDEPTAHPKYLQIREESGRDITRPSQRYAKYSEVDSIITSPPYEDIAARDRSKEASFEREKSGEYPHRGDLNISKGYSVDSIITSPPYEAAQSGGGIAQEGYQGPKHGPTDLVGKRSYMPENIGDAEGNIGNLKSESYLEAMLQVYQQCHKVLKPQGLMILVTKNFIRDKQVVRLDEDTIKLCDQAGFSFLERHYRKLSSQSFWRIIYHQKYPGVEKIEDEDVLVFRK